MGNRDVLVPSLISRPSPPLKAVKIPRPRGRLKKGVAKEGHPSTCLRSTTFDGSEVESTGKEFMVLSKELSNPYGVMTHARGAILVGKRLGLSFNCPYIIVVGWTEGGFNFL